MAGARDRRPVTGVPMTIDCLMEALGAGGRKDHDSERTWTVDDER